MRNQHPLKLPPRHPVQDAGPALLPGSHPPPLDARKNKTNLLFKVKCTRRAARVEQRAETCRELTLKELGCRIKRLL